METFVESLLTHGYSAAEQFKTEKGYDTVEFLRVTIVPQDQPSIFKVRYHFELLDDFQKDLEYSDRVAHSYDITITGNDNNSILKEVHHWPNREMRELSVMARKLGNAETGNDKLISAGAQVFAEEIARKAKKLRLLTARSADGQIQKEKSDQFDLDL